jgi:nitrate/nitrite-specific signal transduction histidine kinase
MPRKSRFPLHRKSIQSRLLFGFILVAMCPTLAVSLGSMIFGYLNAQNKSVDRLESMVDRKQAEINFWVNNGLNELVGTLNETNVLERVQVILKLANREADLTYQFYKEGALFRFQRYLADTKILRNISLLDLQGRVVISTTPGMEGSYFGDQSFYQENLQDQIINIVNQPGSENVYQLLAIHPVFDLDGNRIGVLLGKFDPEGLQQILSSINPAIPTSERVYLVNQDQVILDSSNSWQLIVDEPKSVGNGSDGISKALNRDAKTFSIYRDFNNQWVYGVYRWMPKLTMALIIEQDLSSALGDIFINQAINLGIILVGIILASTVSLLTARSIASPLMMLSKKTAQVAAGDLYQTVEIDQDDEVGLLANSFNSMTVQLRDLITGLENRVEDRTSKLKDSNDRLIRRAAQMQAIYQLSREITSILDLKELLPRVVNLVQESVGYYAVTIYLVDPVENKLRWYASSGTGSPSQKMLEIDAASLNGKAALENQAVLVNDVKKESCFLSDEDLPETRAELVIPLQRGSHIIGTLDVHSTNVNAFDEDDMQLIQALGDQIAIAIQNAQLYERSQKLAVIEERNRLARELHDSISQLLYSQVWFADASQKYLHSQKTEIAEQYLGQLQDSAYQALKEMRLMIYELLPPIFQTEGLVGTIKHRLEVVEQRSGMETHTQIEANILLDHNTEKTLYFISQEVLNNILKHSKAKSVQIKLERVNGTIVMEISDDGKGFDKNTVKPGIGLSNIAKYAQDIGGVLNIDTSPGNGTRVRVEIQGDNHD